MENPHHIPDAGDHAHPEEEISNLFICPVCLDLLYKPIVLACGHVSCFWCVFRSMNVDRKSHCPLCRNPYYHFPNICQLLHSLLLKLYPVAFKRRQSQILEQEEKRGISSPQLDVAGESVGKELSADMEGEFSVSCYGAVVTDQVKYYQQESGSSQWISVADVLCAECKDLVFRPVVLNCGHVYCESCIVEKNEEKLQCQVCPSLHPTGCPKVCLDLHNFLIEQFSEEVAHRKNDVQLKHVNATTCESESKSSKEAERSSPMLCHPVVGCDFCGMYPIMGDRYRCKDCTERIGFDLCTDCYNTSSKLPGRFNQQHTAEHQFECISGNNIIRGRVRPPSEPIRGLAVFVSRMLARSTFSEGSDRDGDVSHGSDTTSNNSEIDEDNQDDSEGNSPHGDI